MLRLTSNLQHKLITDIDALRVAFPGTPAGSVADTSEFYKPKESSHKPVTFDPTLPGEESGATTSGTRLPLTKASLDLMDTPVPSGVLAEEFAYHGLAPSFLKEMHHARQVLDEIYTEIKMYSDYNLVDIRHSKIRRELICSEFQLA
jgi:hypothetical protein